MAEAGIDPIEQVPDADLLQPQAPAYPGLISEERTTVHRDSPIDPADEADWAEQAAALPTSDDDYAHTSHHEREHDG